MLDVGVGTVKGACLPSMPTYCVHAYLDAYRPGREGTNRRCEERAAGHDVAIKLACIEPCSPRLPINGCAVSVHVHVYHGLATLTIHECTYISMPEHKQRLCGFTSPTSSNLPRHVGGHAGASPRCPGARMAGRRKEASWALRRAMQHSHVAASCCNDVHGCWGQGWRCVC